MVCNVCRTESFVPSGSIQLRVLLHPWIPNIYFTFTRYWTYSYVHEYVFLWLGSVRLCSWGFNPSNWILLLFAVLFVDCRILARVLICGAFIFARGGKWMCSVASILPVISPGLLCVWWPVARSLAQHHHPVSPTLPHIWRCLCVNCALWGFW